MTPKAPLLPSSSTLRAMMAWMVVLWMVAVPAITSAEIIDRIVAKINSEIITLNDLKRASGPYLLAFGIEPGTLDGRKDAPEIYTQVLDDMINTRLLVQEANSLQLKVTDADVARWIENTVQQQRLTQDQFKAALQQKGIRWQDYRTYIRDNLLKFRVIQVRIGSKVKVSQQDIDRAYNDVYDEGPGNGAKVIDVSHIFVPKPKDGDEETLARAKKLIEDTHQRVLEAKEDFAAIAREVSAGPTSQDGGYLGTYRSGDLSGEIEEVVFAAEAGDTTAPIEVESGFHIFRLHEIRTERDPRVEERMNKLRGKLREEQLNKQLTGWLETLRQKSYVKVMF